MKNVQKLVSQIGEVLGKLVSFNNSLKLYHWHVTGPGSYAQHMALDQAIDDLTETLDSLAETSYALVGDVKIVVPETTVPTDIIKHVEECYNYITSPDRGLFTESFAESLLDDYQQTIQQLLYRLKRLQ